jgi:flagellar hook-associated protein 2
MDSIVSTLGAGSGIDTRTLIDQLVAAEKTARTTPLNTRATALDARISALGQVRSALQGIAASLDTRVKSGALGLAPASNDSAAIDISRQGDGPAVAFSTAITVNRLAAAQRLNSPALSAADAPVGLGTLTLSFGTRTDLGGGSFSFSSGAAAPVDITITAANNSLTGLRDAINAANAGVTASIIANAGSATLSLKGPDGANQAFILSVAEDTANPGLARFAYTPGNRAMTLASAATDADLSVDGVAVRRSSNVIDDLIPGTRLTLKKADAAMPVTVSAARDGAELSATLSDFASTLGAMRSLIADFRKGATGSDAAGALVNDATARAIDQRLANLATTPFSEANGLALRDLGLSVARDGSVSFDAARFARLSPSRYADAEKLLQTLAAPALSTRPNRLQSIAELVTPTTTGLARQRSSVTRDLATVDQRLATYRAQLVRQYAAMDKLVAASKAVEAQLDQQIAAWNNQKTY